MNYIFNKKITVILLLILYKLYTTIIIINIKIIFIYELINLFKKTSKRGLQNMLIAKKTHYNSSPTDKNHIERI